MVLEIHGHPLSQPSRAVLIFARANNIDYEMKNTMPGDTSPEYLAINPTGQIPAIVDNSFKLYESHAILKYLAETRSTPDHWYPADPKRRAIVDCILNWHHLNLREGKNIVFQKVMTRRRGLSCNEDVVKRSTEIFRASMKFMEDNWLAGEGPFLGGATEPSIADLSLACEVEQMKLLDRSDREAVMQSRGKTIKWVQAVEDSISPYFGEVHNLLRALLDRALGN